MDSNQSGKQMSLDSFKAHLELMVANVMDMVTREQEATGTAVIFDRNSLMGCIESCMPQENQYVVEIPRAGDLGSFFSKLPRELRDQIFSELLTLGNPQFMSVSRATNAEGKALIYKKGIYRMNFGYDVSCWQLGSLYGNCPSPIQNIADNIRHLSITIKVKDFTSFSTTQGHSAAFQYVDVFMGYLLTPGVCHMSACCNQVARTLWNIILIIRRLTAFDTVLLHIDTNSDYRNASEDSRRWENTRISGIRETAERDLEPFLGKEVVQSDKDGLRLVFHPRKAPEETVPGSDRELRATDVHTYMRTQMGRSCCAIWSA